MTDENEISHAGDNSVMEYITYEDYLDSQITPVDLFYLEVIYSFIRIRNWRVN
jgi:hypothetical protein